MNSCDNVQAELSAYLDGEITAQQRAEVDGHLHDCEKCREVLTELRSIIAVISGLPRVHAPLSLEANVRRELAGSSPPASARPRKWGAVMMGLAAMLVLSVLVFLVIPALGRPDTKLAMQPPVSGEASKTESRKAPGSPAPGLAVDKLEKPEKLEKRDDAAPAALDEAAPKPGRASDSSPADKSGGASPMRKAPDGVAAFGRSMPELKSAGRSDALQKSTQISDQPVPAAAAGADVVAPKPILRNAGAARGLSESDAKAKGAANPIIRDGIAEQRMEKGALEPQAPPAARALSDAEKMTAPAVPLVQVQKKQSNAIVANGELAESADKREYTVRRAVGTLQDAPADGAENNDKAVAERAKTRQILGAGAGSGGNGQLSEQKYRGRGDIAALQYKTANSENLILKLKEVAKAHGASWEATDETRNGTNDRAKENEKAKDKDKDTGGVTSSLVFTLKFDAGKRELLLKDLRALQEPLALAPAPVLAAANGKVEKSAAPEVSLKAESESTEKRVALTVRPIPATPPAPVAAAAPAAKTAAAAQATPEQAASTPATVQETTEIQIRIEIEVPAQR